MGVRYILVFGRMFGLRLIGRVYALVISYIMMPLALLFLFSIVSGGSLLPYALVGGFLYIIITNALYVMFDSANFRLQYKIQDLMVATSISPASYMAGIAIADLVFAVPGITIFTIIGFLLHFYTLPKFLLMCCIILICYIATTGIAFTASFIPKHIRSIWGYSGIIAILLVLLPPIYYPYTILPKSVLYLFLLVPTTSASIMIQNIYGLTPTFSPAPYILIIETVLYLVVAVFFTRWRSK